MTEIEEFEKFHPRAIKLLRKRKNFLVISESEPYFLLAYAMVRKHEMLKGTWSAEDESAFRDAELSVHPTEAGGAWTCTKCNEVVSGDFDKCWNCYTPRLGG